MFCKPPLVGILAERNEQMKMKQSILLMMAIVLPFIGFSKSTLKTLVLSEDVVLEPESDLTFTLGDSLDDLPFPYEVLSFSPDGVSVEWTGRSFKTPKAGKVKYVKSDGDFDDVKESDNPCGLKVSINKKTGKVSGSFKVYTAKTEKKLKTYTAKISGYVGSDTLTVTIKKIGTISASLE